MTDLEKEIDRVIKVLDGVSKLAGHRGKGVVELFYDTYLNTLMREYAKTDS